MWGGGGISNESRGVKHSGKRIKGEDTRVGMAKVHKIHIRMSQLYYHTIQLIYNNLKIKQGGEG